AAMAAHFLRRSAQQYASDVEAIAPRGLDWLKTQPWPGNIRQLKQLIERAVLIRGGRTLDVDDFVAVHDLQSAAAARDEALPEAGTMTLDEIEKGMILKCLRHYDGNVSRVAEALGLSRAALYRRFEKYDIALPKGD